MDAGFFKVRIDTKGRFLYANEKTISILGFNGFEEMSKSNILSTLADADERKTIKKTLAETGVLKNKVYKILKPNGDYSFIALSMVLINSENSGDLVCDGIIEDITIAENGRLNTVDLIADLKTNNFLLEQPVKGFLTKVFRIDSDSTLNNAISVLAINKTDSLLVTKNGNDHIGILTSTDIQKRILAMNLNLDNPVYMIMSSPVTFITENTSILDAIRISEEKGIRHLPVKNGAEEITGVLRIQDIHHALTNSLSFYIQNVRKAATEVEIKHCYTSLRKLINSLIKSEISIKYITDITTSFSDEVIRRTIELSIIDSGEPPVNFSFICLGSEGRKEETLFTDQDNAIIYDDVTDKKKKEVSEYFLKLGTRVCNSLNYIGYSFCKGNIMASNPKWCKPLSDWKKYFSEWITTPEPQNLLDATVFFDFRSVYGDQLLSDELVDSVSSSIDNNPLFLYHLAHNTYYTKPPHISSGSILSEKSTELIDLKIALSPIIMFVRTYSLQNKIRCTNTIERLMALKEKNIISENRADEIIFVYKYFMKLRFRNQADLMNKSLPLSNTLNAMKLIDTELFLLKKIISYIPDIQNKIKTDFRITT
jgi:CBS domain-containing protein